jgi:hypothetical protein
VIFLGPCRKTYRILYTTIRQSKEKPDPGCAFSPWRAERIKHVKNRAGFKLRGGDSVMPRERERNRNREREMEMDIINKEANEEAAQDYIRIEYDPDEIT